MSTCIPYAPLPHPTPLYHIRSTLYPYCHIKSALCPLSSPPYTPSCLQAFMHVIFHATAQTSAASRCSARDWIPHAGPTR